MSAADIQKQVEFYFSDSNYRKDTFLRAAAESDPEGFVPISVLLTFNKLKQLTTDVDVVAAALKDSETVAVSTDGKKLKRATPLPNVDTSADRTMYVKGYPMDDADVTIESIAAQFSTFGKVNYVRLRRDGEKKFKGSCFVEFSTEEEMQNAVKAANADDKMNLSYKETPFLCIIPFKTWHDNKAAKFAKRKNNEESAGGKRKAEDAAEEPEEVQFEQGLIVKLSELPANTTAITVKEFLKKHVDVKFVDYTAGETTATVRLADADASKKLIELTAGELMFPQEGADDVKLHGVLISGEEETAFWTKKASEGKNSARNNNRNFGKGGKGGKGGYKKGGFKKQRR